MRAVKEAQAALLGLRAINTPPVSHPQHKTLTGSKVAVNEMYHMLALQENGSFY